MGQNDNLDFSSAPFKLISRRDSFGQALAKIGLPAFGEGSNLQSSMNDVGILIAKSFSTRRGVCHEQASDFRDRDCARVARKQLDLIAGADFALARDLQVEAGAGTCQKALHHVVGLKTDAQFVARQAGLRDDYFRGTDSEAVAKMHGIFQQAFRREVFSENGKRKIAARQLFLPKRIVFDGIAVDRFVFAAVDPEVGLTVAVQIQLAENYVARDRLLKDAGSDDRVVPGHFARKANVDGDELHCAAGLSEPRPESSERLNESD